MVIIVDEKIQSLSNKRIKSLSNDHERIKLSGDYNYRTLSNYHLNTWCPKLTCNLQSVKLRDKYELVLLIGKNSWVTVTVNHLRIEIKSGKKDMDGSEEILWVNCWIFFNIYITMICLLNELYSILLWFSPLVKTQRGRQELLHTHFGFEPQWQKKKYFI